MSKEDIQRLNAISQVLFDKKGFNILVLDVRGLSTMTDYFVIAEGTVGRHVKSLCAAVKGEMEQAGMTLFHCEGERDSEWIVMDFGEIVIHLFVPDLREKYALEELWKKATIVDVHIVVTKN